MQTRKLKTVLLAVLCMLMLCGCGKVFVDESKRYSLQPYSRDQLENDIYYVKDGSNFYRLHMPEDAGSCYYLGKDISLVPDLYSDECLAFRTKDLFAGTLKLQRFSDEGFTIGAFGLSGDGTGCYTLNSDKSSVSDSDAYRVFRRASSANIRIETINGKKCSDYPLSSSGTLRGFYENETVCFTMYCGSVYTEANITADTHMLVPFESIESASAVATKVGYISISMPDNAKSGYYFLKGFGFFRYHDHKRGECAPEGDDLNVPCSSTILDELLERYQQYSVIVSARTLDVTFDVSYDEKSADEEVQCVLQSPANDIYYLERGNGSSSITLSEVIAGRWTFNIYPKGTTVTDFGINSSKASAESMCSEFLFETDHIIPYAEFETMVSGDGEVWGTVENVDTGESMAITVTNGRPPRYICQWTYLPVGKYKMRVFHYFDTSVVDAQLFEVEDGFDSEEIILIGD